MNTVVLAIIVWMIFTVTLITIFVGVYLVERMIWRYRRDRFRKDRNEFDYGDDRSK